MKLKLKLKGNLRIEIIERSRLNRLTMLCITKEGYWEFSPHYRKGFNPRKFIFIGDVKNYTHSDIDKLIKKIDKKLMK